MYGFIMLLSEQLMPIISFLFMFFLLNSGRNKKLWEIIIISICFALMCWAITGAILLAGHYL